MVDTEDTDLKKDMLDALATIQDPGQRIVLMLLMRSMDNISHKLDKVLSDEAKIKHIVLNGHSDAHDAHHKWVDEQIAKKVEHTESLDFIKARRNNGGLCEFAKRKVEEEKALNASKRKISEGIVEKILVAVLMFVAGVWASIHLPL
jgi:hypothetical protein